MESLAAIALYKLSQHGPNESPGGGQGRESGGVSLALSQSSLCPGNKLVNPLGLWVDFTTILKVCTYFVVVKFPKSLIVVHIIWQVFSVNLKRLGSAAGDVTVFDLILSFKNVDGEWHG